MQTEAAHDRVKLLRQQLGKTQREVANLLGVKPSYYSDVENRRRPVTKKLVAKLSSVFNVSPDWVLNGAGRMYPENVPQNVPYESPDDESQIHDGFSEYKAFRNYSEGELDLILSIEIEAFRDSFEDIKTLTHAIHSIDPPDFIIQKFPKFGGLNDFPEDFNEYRKSVELEFSETHAHVRNSRRLKMLKIIELYRSETEHMRRMTSMLINYFDRYSDFFFDKLRRKN